MSAVFSSLRKLLSVSTLATKILFPIVFAFVLLVLLFLGYILNEFNASQQTRQIENQKRTEQIIKNELKRLGDFALALAVEAAENPEIQKALANRERSRLQALTLDSFNTLKEKFGIRQYQYHIPPAFSFLRLHSLNTFGDDLSSYRLSVVQVNQTKQSVSGIEVGRGGVGMRGVQPVFYQGVHIGSVEFGFNVDEGFVKSLKEEYGNEWRILLTRQSLQSAPVEDISQYKAGPIQDLVILGATIDGNYQTSAAYSNILSGETITTELRNDAGQIFLLTSVPIRDYGNRIVCVAESLTDITSTVRADTNRLLLVLSGVFAIFGVGVFVMIAFTNYTLTPLRNMTTMAVAIEKGDFSQRINITSRDEISVLASAFNSMANQLQSLFTSLEHRVQERTRALELAADVSQRISAIRDQSAMVVEVVEQLKQTFNYYHAHIYLFDENRENLVMVGGTGEVGKTLLERGHKIPRGRGLVGRAAESGEAVLVPDTRSDPGWLPNPLLPETRAEVAVPIVVNERVLGVLDVQNDQVGSLSELDVLLIRTVADQVGIALENLRANRRSEELLKDYQHLIETSPAAIAILDAQTGVFVQANPAMLELFELSLEDMGKTGPVLLSPEFQPDGRSSQQAAQEKIERALREGQHIFEWVHRSRTGREFRTEIRLTPAPNREGRPMLNAIITDITARYEAEQQARRRAEREAALNRLAQAIQGTLSVEDALRITARELGQVLGKKPVLAAIQAALSSQEKDAQ